MLRCYYMDISCDCSYEQSLALYGVLPEERQAKIKQMKNVGLAKKRILSGAFLQYVLSRVMEVPMKEIIYQYGEFGKPALAETVICSDTTGLAENRIHFNLSHSGRFAVIAVSDTPVGIDIEGQKKNRLAVAKRCFCMEEYEDIVAAPSGEEQDRRFLEYWTMKEAYVKWSGDGLRMPLNSFMIEKREKELSYVEGQHGKICFATCFLEKYCVSVCCKNRQELEKIHKHAGPVSDILQRISVDDISGAIPGQGER